uniref:CPBP family intramembrane metalloprotease n=1 Tax=Heterorhabditis bacteriophora TaxID=37862 RepID=A0A1I7WHN8_HETBA
MVMWDNNYEYVNLPIACIVGVIYGKSFYFYHL